MTHKLRVIDLFAGIGGIRLGFELAFGKKMETVFVNEWDVYARKTYSANFEDSFEISGDDITTIKAENVPSFDICLAGFPCQAFSQAGHRKGFDDNFKGVSRGVLFQDVVRICERHKPKIIFCENVKGLLLHNKKKTYNAIKAELNRIGYSVFEQVLNSKDFGVPQNRERIYVVALNKDEFRGRKFIFPEPTKRAVKLRDIIEQNPVASKYYLSEVYLNTLRNHRARHEAKGNGFGYEIKDWDGIANAIVCGGMGRERNLIVDIRQTELIPTTRIKGGINEEAIRKMTPREWARLQGYPDSFELKLADVHLYKQLGNSVTVTVIKAIAEQIKQYLCDSQKHKMERVC